MHKELYTLLEDFLLMHLPRHRGCSNNTVVSYYTALEQFVTWVAAVGGYSRDKVKMLDFTNDAICAWLDSLETKGLSTSLHKFLSNWLGGSRRDPVLPLERLGR